MTLVELFIVVAISALITIALISLYTAGRIHFFSPNSPAAAIGEGRMPMARISRDIRGAWAVLDSAKGTRYRTNGNCIVLRTHPADDGAWDVVLAFDPLNHRLLRVTPGTSAVETRVLADNLFNDAALGAAFRLKYFKSDGLTAITSSYADPVKGASVVEVELTARRQALQRGREPFVVTVKTQAKLRQKTGDPLSP